MGILSRMLRLCKADAHGVMDQLEDKGLLLKQYLREMESSLEEKDNRLARIVQQCRQVESDLARRKDEAQKLEIDLDLAVRKEKDDIAKMLIRKRRTLESFCEQLSSQIENLIEEKSKLSETLAQHKLQYEQLKIKTTAFCQQTQQQVFEQAAASAKAPSEWSVPSDEEIELELLQRKEALRKGGAA